MWNKLREDNFLTGLMAGLLSMMMVYAGLRMLRSALAEYYGNPFFFPTPRIELITILCNVILFRIVIINLKKDKTGRGILFITVLLSMIFFYLFFKMNNKFS